MHKQQVIIIGAGLAGLTSAIHLSKKGLAVTVVEKNTFPKHKVCGEYISNEVLPYLEWLGLDYNEMDPAKIDQAAFSTASGKTITTALPLGGFGVSRYTFDAFLYQKALQNGCRFIHDSVTEIAFENETFTVTLSDATTLKSQILLGAFGKRSNIDQQMSRNFISKKSPWLAVKAHYAGDFPDNLVGLHNFRGGYCGVSKVEGNQINVCYLADYDTFKKHRNISEYEQQVLCQNPNLKQLFNGAEMLFDKPITISQISFEKKEAVENHILMIGDTAGLIHPLCGNGMAIAIHSAKIASGMVLDFFNGSITSRKDLEQNYAREWNRNFRNRLRTGRRLGALLQNETIAAGLMNVLALFPALLPYIIRKTHGKPISINE